VRGHRRGRGQSLHGRRGAPARGGAHKGEGEAIPWPEVPVSVEALSAATAVRRRAEAGERGARRQNRGVFLGAWQHGGRAHDVVAACAARGGGVAGGRPRRREVASGDQTTAALAHAWAGTHGCGPTWATGKRAPSLVLFPKFQNQHKLCNLIW
jgi:hypothetical protein